MALGGSSRAAVLGLGAPGGPHITAGLGTAVWPSILFGLVAMREQGVPRTGAGLGTEAGLVVVKKQAAKRGIEGIAGTEAAAGNRMVVILGARRMLAVGDTAGRVARHSHTETGSEPGPAAGRSDLAHRKGMTGTAGR